ncbi:MAG: peptidoglycan DD-metalloendopeptidase family protein [Bacillota bacterium]|nr:peptidoglycan DD-metalloendopeptidase family protein [Bacillota bacterium]
MPNPRRGGKTTNYKHEQRKEAAKKASSVLKETAKTVKQTAEKITNNSATSRAAQSQQSHSSNSRKTSTQNRQQNYQMGNSRLRYGTGASQNRSGGSKSTSFQDRMEKYQGNPRKRMPQEARQKAEERSERLTNLTKGTARQIAGSHVKALSSLYATDEEKNTERTGVNGVGGNARRRGSRYVGQKGRNDRRTQEQKRNAELQLQKARETNVSVKNAKSRNAKKASEWASGQIDKGTEEIEKGKKGLGKAGSFAADVYSGGLGLGADALAGPLAIPAMFSRAYGSSYHTAEKEGANKKQASLYAAGAAGLEAASEKLFAVATPLRKLYGKGAGDEVADRFINKVVSKMSTQTGKDVAYHGTKTLMAAITEGLEEMVSEGLEPTIANQIYANALGNPHETSVKDIFYAGAVGGALGGILGGSGQVIEYGQGKKVQDIYGETGIRDLARKAQESDEDSGDDVKGAAINEMINNGQGVAAGQANELYNAVYKQSIKDMQREDLAIKSAESIMQREGLQSPVKVNEETGEMLIGRKTSENFEAAKAEASDVMEQLQLPDVNSEKIVSAVAAIQTGIAGIDEINMFTKGNPEARTVYETMTGIKLPETNKETRELLYETMAINRVNSARAETTDYLDRLKGSVQQDVTRNYEKAGQQAFTELFKDVDAENKDKFESFIIAFDDYYSAGRAGIDYAAIASIDNPAYKNITVQARKAAYEAGQQDRFLADDTANGLQIKIGQTAKEIRSQTKTGASRGKLIFDLSRENKAAVTASEQNMFRMLAKSLNINIHIVDDLDGANGYYLDGEVYLAMNADRGLEYVFAHEVTHHMQKYAPEEYNKLKELVRTKWTQQGGMNDALGEKIAQYAAHDVELTREDALDEIIADSTYEMLQDEGFIDEVCKTDRGIAQAILDAIKAVLKKLRAVLSEGDEYTPKQNAELLSNLDILKEFERLWADGLARAAENRAAVGSVGTEARQQARQRVQPFDITRGEILQNMKTVTDMSPVVTLDGSGFEKREGRSLSQAVMDYYGGKEFYVNNPTLGDVKVGKRGIKSSVQHRPVYGTKIEGFKALKEIISGGEVINASRNYAGKRNDRICVAAPIKIGNDIYYAGVIINRNADEGMQNYYLHDVITIEKNSFSLKDTEAQNESARMDETVSPYTILQQLNNINNLSEKDVISDEGRFSLPELFPERTVTTNELVEMIDVKSALGVRGLADDEHYEIGDTLRESFDWDYENDVSTYDTDNPQPLGGTSAYNVDINWIMDDKEDMVEKLDNAAKSNYLGEKVLISGYEAEYGADYNEIIIPNAVVVAKYNKADGRWIVSSKDVKYSLPDEDDINDYINSNHTEFVDVPPVKDYEREAQRIKNMSIGELQEQVKKLRNDKLFTKGKILDKESVREEMNNLVKTLVSYREGARNKTDWNILEMLMENASTIYTAIKDGDVSGASITAWEAALNVVENLRLVDDSMFNEYKDLRDTMRNTQVTISEDDKTSIPDFKDFRKKNMGRLAIVNEGGIPVDTLYGELCDKYPELFDAEITHPADQLIAMAEVRDSLEPYDVMLSDEETEQLVKETAQDILDISARGKSWKSFADKKKEYYDNKVKTLKARHIEAKRDAIAKRDEMWEKRLAAEKQKAKDIKATERERADKRVNAEKQKARDKADKQKQRKEHMKRFGSIYKNYKWLSDRLVTPTDDKHIPEGFRASVADLLQQMDFQTERSIKLEAKYGKSGNTLRMEELRRRLAEISKEDGSGIFEYDGYIFELMDALAEKLEGKTIDQATNEELASIDTLLKSIVCNVRNYNKAFSDSIKETISALGDNAINTAKDVISHRKKRRYDRTGALGGLDTLMNESMLTPRDFFEQIGGGMETVFMAMRKGFNRHVDNITKTRDFFDTVFAPYHKKTLLRKRAKPGSEIESWRDDSHTQTFNLDSGDTIKLNPAQIMSLYCLSKREQAQGHILGSGIIASRVDNASKLKQALGAKLETEGSAVMVTLSDLSKIISALTPEQIEMADKLQGYLNDECAEWGNEVSMRLYGYKKFTEENYFPIKSADAYLDSNFESREQVERIKNFGFTKGTIINANNPIMVDDIFRVVADHINKMSLYNAFAAPISDFTRVYNYKQRDEGGLLTGSVKSSLEDAYGRKAINYINRFMADVNNTTKTRVEGMMRFVNKSLANYKKATIGFNMRVALQQPTAVMRAFVLMNPKYFVNGSLNVKKNLKDMKAHCQIARWKSWGYNQVDMARDIDDIMMNNEWSRIDTVTMEIYGALDNITWSTIWAAVRKETKAKYPDVKVDSDEFYRLCNERASEVFDKTQVVDSVFHRSQVMRNTETMSKMMTSFMAEPTRTFNMVRTELVKARDLWNQGEKGKAAGKANRALSVFVLNAAAVSAAAAIADSLRGKDADDDDEPDKWWENALANFWDNINILNMIPVAKDIWGFVDGWGSQNMALEGYEALVKSIMEIPAAENKSEAWLKVAESMGLVMGLPVKNVIRELKVLGIDVYAAEVGSESEDKEKSIIDKIPGLSNIKGFVSGLIKDGSSLDNVLNKFGRNLTDEEKEQSEYDKTLSDINGDIEGLSGTEREEAIWKKVTADYTTYIKNGEFSELRKMRKMLGDLGGDVEKFDESVLSKTKTALKKNIGEDSVKVWEYRVFLKDQYDMTDGKINQEVIMKSDASKEFQKAACFDDYDGMVNTISALYDAGLSEGELDILYESRSKAIDVSELSTGEFTFPASGEITSSFGYRNAPTAGASSYHEAIDIGAAAGSDVAAADGGQVTYCGWYGGKGNMVRIKHGNGTYTEYSHLQGYTVQKGDAVAKGQTIGLVGSTGVSTGPHLDFRVKVNGTYVDPMIYFK